MSPQQIALERDRRKNLLLNPNFSGMADYLGTEIPLQLVKMYSKKDLIEKTDFEVRNPENPDDCWQISAFLPADPEEYKNMWDETKRRFCIAESTSGDPFYVDVLSFGLPVYIYHHDSGDIEKVASSLGEFLSWIN